MPLLGNWLLVLLKEQLKDQSRSPQTWLKRGRPSSCLNLLKERLLKDLFVPGGHEMVKAIRPILPGIFSKSYATFLQFAEF